MPLLQEKRHEARPGPCLGLCPRRLRGRPRLCLAGFETAGPDGVRKRCLPGFRAGGAAGGLAAGILISALFKRSPTRKIGNRAAKAASGLAATGAEFALGYALQAWEAANEAGRASAEKLEEIGTAARSARREAAGRASELGTAARSKTRGAGKRLREALNGRNT